MSVWCSQKKFVLAGGSHPNPTNIPTTRTITNRKSSLKSARMPGADAVRNVLDVFGKVFIREFIMYPDLSIMMATDQGLGRLEQYGETILVDGTFDLAECGLQLTTIMVLINNVAIPVAFLWSESRTAAMYARFFAS